MEHQSLEHDLDNLCNSHVVFLLLKYRGVDPNMIEFGLFKNPSRVADRICSIFKKVKTELPEQQADLLVFFIWLKDKFLPFLAHAEQFVSDVRSKVDKCLRENKVPTIENMLNLFRKHFSKKPLMVLRCILANRVPPAMRMTRYAWNSPIIRLAMAKMYGFCCEVSPAMAARVGLTAEALSILLSNVENLSQIQEKPFYGKLLTLSVAQKFLIKRLFCPKDLGEKSLLMMQLLRRSFP
jgi:hypothetical protein